MEKLEIRHNLVADDGNYTNENDMNWTDVWYVNYDGNCFIVDSQGFPISLGKIDMVPDSWHTLKELGDVNIDHYPHLLNSVLQVVEAIHSKNKPSKQDMAIKVFDLLWSNYSNFIDNPIDLGWKLDVPMEYMECFEESMSNLDIH